MGRFAAAALTRRPVCTEPTNTTFLVMGLAMALSPIDWPRPLMTFSTPAGKPASMASLASAIDVSGVSSEGLSSTALPMARAGAMFQAAR
ncbi:hypothetical protein D3C78_1436720 [compost metagenome]